MIKLSHVNKYYNQGKSNEIHVINDISFTLSDTGFVTLFGASGSGKTTLLNVIGGLDSSTGEITYDQQTFKNYSKKQIDQYRKHNIGYIFQNYNLINDKTVWENLKIALDVIHVHDEEEVKKRIEYSLKAVGLYKFRKKPAFALSGGQMQRVSIARALVKNCKIIIADEPTGNLDSDNSIEIMEILKKISKNSLVLLVTHDRQLAEFYSDEIIEIKDGKVMDQRKPSADVTLSGKKNENIIYLKDMHKEEQINGKVKYEIYTNTEDFQNIEFQLVQKNNQFILKSNYPIKLLEDTPLQLIDDHYHEIKKDKYQQDFDYDTSWYSHKPSKNTLKSIRNDFVSSFKSFIFSRKMQKFFSIALMLIGVVIGFLNIMLASYSKIDESRLNYDSKLYGVASKISLYQLDEYDEFLKENIKSKQIEQFYFADPVEEYIVMHLSTFDTKSFSLETNIFEDTLIKNDQIICGRRSIEENEFVVSKPLADYMLKKLKIKEGSYDALFNRNLFYSGQIIVGVVDRDCRAIYCHNENEISSVTILDSFYNQYYIDIANKNAISYTIVDDGKSRDILNPFEGLCNVESPYRVGDMIGDVKIVGKYRSSDSIFAMYDDVILLDRVTNNYLKYHDNYSLQYFVTNLFFDAETIEKLESYFSQNKYEIKDMYTIRKNELLAEGNEAKAVSIPIVICLVALVLVYIYFTMRSKMINDIYLIGVLRALGNSRIRIIQKYFIDILVISCFTTLLGYVIVCLIYGWLTNHMSEYVSIVQIHKYWSTYFFGFVTLFANILIGLIPIATLLKKTPSEIIAKYDI